MPREGVSSITMVLAKPQTVMVALRFQGEAVIVGACPTPPPVLQEYQQLVVPTARHLMHGLQAQPVFSFGPPKAHLEGREKEDGASSLPSSLCHPPPQAHTL